MNYYHQEFPRIPFLKGVGLVWVNFATFILSYIKIFESPHSWITKIQATSTLSSSPFKTPFGLNFLPFKWSKREINGMFQNSLTWILKQVWPLFITSITFSKVLDVQLLHVNSARTWFVFTNLLIGCVGVVSGMFSLSTIACSYKPFRCLWGTFDIMVALTSFLALASSNLVGFD